MVESLERLSAAVVEWRTGKKHEREKWPEALLKRARRAAKTHGVNPVVRALKVDRRRLEGAETATGEERSPGPVTAPAYSRVEMPGLATSARPFAELELPSGVKLRLYSASQETMGLLSSVCGAGGGR
jgi:hypothetical protein